METGIGQATALRFGKIAGLETRLKKAIAGAQNFLFSRQHEEGWWCGELEADTTLESDYILLHTLLGTGNAERIEKAARYILRHQNADGGWSIYAGGPSNISASVKAYFGLKLAGYKTADPPLARARTKILEMGGVTEVNTFTKIYLCFFGQYDYDAVPAVPPEIVLFPNWFWFNIYEISSWSRAILVPLSIAYAKKPFKKIPPEILGKLKESKYAIYGNHYRRQLSFGKNGLCSPKTSDYPGPSDKKPHCRIRTIGDVRRQYRLSCADGPWNRFLRRIRLRQQHIDRQRVSL